MSRASGRSGKTWLD